MMLVMSSAAYAASSSTGGGRVLQTAADPVPTALMCDASKTVLLIQDNVPWSNTSVEPLGADVQELKTQSKNFCMINSTMLSTTNLAQFKEIIIPSAQTQDFYNNTFPGGTIDTNIVNWVNSGGVLSANLADNASGPGGGHWGGDVFVGGVQQVGNYSNDNNINNPANPVITGAFGRLDGGHIVDTGNFTDLDGWGSSSHGYFTNLPAGTDVILTQPDVTGDGIPEPVMIEYRVGKGTVIATMTTIEWRYVGGFGGGLPQNEKLLANEIGYQDHLVSIPTPTLTPTGLIAFAGLLGLIAAVSMRRRL